MSKQSQTPQPMSFAVLRNTHEVLRKSIELMSKALENDDKDAFRQEWNDFQRCRQTHLSMEDGAVFVLLDDLSGGAITEAGLGEEHVTDLKNVQALNLELNSELPREAFETWKTHQLEHLAHEERVMGPLTMKTAATPEGRGQVVHDVLIPPAVSHGDFDWYLGFVIKRLTRYGTSNQSASVAVRVFAWGLQYAADPAQWSVWKDVIKMNTSEEIWAEMVAGFQIDAPGRATV